MHGPSSRKRCFVLEGESKVLGVEAAAFRKGTSWDYGGTGNLMLLSVLSLVVVDWRKGLPGRRPAEQCQGGRREAKKPSPGTDGHEDAFLLLPPHFFMAAYSQRMDTRVLVTFAFEGRQ